MSEICLAYPSNSSTEIHTFFGIYNYSNGVVEILGLYSRVKNLYIGVVYRQPDDRVGGYRSTGKKFYSALSKLGISLAYLTKPSPNISISGDFNIRHALWPDGVQSSVSTSQEKLLL